MTTNRTSGPRRRLDVWGLVLLLVGALSGLFSYWLITTADVNVLVIVPSIVAATIGALHLTKLEAPRS
jgi:hypothetical protein